MNELNFKYPVRFTFNLVRDIVTGKQFVSAQKTNNQKIMLKNIKYGEVHHFSFEPNKKVALIDVKEIKSENELAEWIDRYEQAWGIKPEIKEANQ